MKRILSIMSLAIAAMMILSCGGGAETKSESTGEAAGESETAKGYRIEGENVVFTFNEADYALFEPTDFANVAGEMNGWDMASMDWALTDDDGDGIWTLSVPLAELDFANTKTPGQVEFKFVQNELSWLQPNTELVDPSTLADDGFDGYNLIIPEQ